MVKTKYRVLKYLLYVLLAVVLSVLQNIPGFLVIAGIKPMLVLSLAISVAMLEGEFVGAIFGGFCGLLCDVFAYTAFGYYAFMFFVFCMVGGLLVHTYMRPVEMNCFLFSFFTMLLTQSISFFFLFLIRWYDSPFQLYRYHILPLCLYTALTAVPLFWGVRELYGRFQKLLDA